MSILDMFRGAAPSNTPAQAQQQATPAQQQPAAAQQQSQQQDLSNGVQNSNTPPNPLDTFKDLWQPAANADAAPAPLFNLDAAKLTEVASKANFATGLTPEIVQSALKGDVNAFTQAINTVGQQAFAQSVLATTKLLEQGFEKHGQAQQALIPGLVKKNLVSNSLQDNPLYKHEATRPLLSALETQLAAKHPNATAAQITDMAQRFVSEFANVAADASRTPEQRQQDNRPDPNDWSGF